MKSTLIAIPCMDMMHTAFVQCLMQADMKPLGRVSIRFQKNTLVYDGRNILTFDAIQNGFTHVLWLDSDITFPPDMPGRLVTAMQNIGADMVTGIYFNRHVNPNPILYRVIEPPSVNADRVPVKNVENYLDYPHDTVFPVAGAGFGCVLTTVSLLRDVLNKYGPPFTPLPWASEYISFCYRANRLGKRIYADSSIRLGHIGQYEFTEKDYRRDGNESKT